MFALVLFAATLHLDPTPQTVAWGHYDAAAKPVLRIRFRRHGGGAHADRPRARSGWKRPAWRPTKSSRRCATFTAKVTDKGPGGHILTGPIFVEGAEPGDVLEVRIERSSWPIPYAYNAFGSRPRLSARRFRRRAHAHHPARREADDGALCSAASTSRCDPFFGSIGVAPPPSMGRVDSAPPGIHAGNLDNKELVAGTTLYIPVHAPGALLEIGDGHAGQGNGEVDITAIETSLRRPFQVVVRKDLHLDWPRAETPTHSLPWAWTRILSRRRGWRCGRRSISSLPPRVCRATTRTCW